MRLALGQMNATISDFAANSAKVASLWKETEVAGADLLLVPEMAFRGYPARDLVDRADHERQQAAPGLRVSTKAFGSGRRIPIAQVAKT